MLCFVLDFFDVYDSGASARFRQHEMAISFNSSTGQYRSPFDILVSTSSSYVRPWTMVLNNYFTHLTSEDGCEVQQPKRSDIPSQQDKEKSPKIPPQKTTIPSSKKNR